MSDQQPIKMFLEDQELSEVLAIPKKAPAKKVVNVFYEAQQLNEQGKHKEAERIYLELLNADFHNCVIQAALGMTYANVGKNGLAVILLESALEHIANLLPDFERLGIKPQNPSDQAALDAFKQGKKAELLNALGTCYKHENKTEKAMELFTESQSLLSADNADIQNNIGTLFINEGTPEKALVHFERCIAVSPEHAQGHWNRSLARLELGNYKEGWPDYDYGVAAKVRMDRQFTQTPLPLWNGEKGARVVVWGEQGIGDEILFASCLPDLLKDCDSVVFDCHKKLHRLFANSFPGVDIYPTREDEMITWPMKPDGTPRYDFTHRVAIGSLPRFYRNDLSDFPGTPYLSPTPGATRRWRAKLDELPARPNVGIAWIGGHKRTRIEVRSIELENWLPILKELDGKANIISLQYTPCEHEIEEFESKHGIKIHHWPEACYNEHYDETAGLVGNLDLVITVCTSLVHLSGSMGVPTWVLTPSRPAWRYRLDLEYMPWYGCTTLFRQAHDSKEWGPVILEVAEAVKGLVDPLDTTTEGDANE